ncbi:MAG: ribonuclease HII, partial [Cyclobacteriaceae bacterium]|nr:ribonuclease HII [Cyclobacteriaceae bacterium]
LTDSKKLSERQRDDLIPLIKEQATAYAIASASHEEIDEINILQASFLAMHRAIEKLPIKPEHLLIDGNRFKPYEDIPYECIIKGDGKYLSIAAASILAKDYRDRHMRQLALEYPQYAWERNVGYATKAHKTAIEEYGRCIHHRKSFLFKEEKERLIKQEKLFGD